MKQLSKEDKHIMLLKMQEHPEEYSEEQFEELLEDEDIQLFVEEMALVKQAMKKNQKTCVNIDNEWQEFSKKHLEGISKASRRHLEWKAKQKKLLQDKEKTGQRWLPLS